MYFGRTAQIYIAAQYRMTRNFAYSAPRIAHCWRLCAMH